MLCYCTAGRGTELFVEKEIRYIYGQNTQVTRKEGKVFFELSHQDKHLLQKLNLLKSVERIFLNVVYECVDSASLDKRGLLTVLHTCLGNETTWKDCIEVLDSWQLATRHGTDLDTGDDGQPPRKCRKTTDESRRAFRISCKLAGKPKLKLNVQKTSMQMAVLVSKVTGWKADTKFPNFEICIHFNDAALTVGIPLTTEPLSRRRYIRHFGLRSTIAWIMVDLLDVQPGDLVLDPMCGAGTILIEGAHVCRAAIFFGMDKNIEQLELTKENIDFTPNAMNIDVLLGDATSTMFPDQSVDRVVTDAPFGHQHKVDDNLELFYTKLLHEMSRVLRSDGRLVLLTRVELVKHIRTLCRDEVHTIHSGHTDKDTHTQSVCNCDVNIAENSHTSQEVTEVETQHFVSVKFPALSRNQSKEGKSMKIDENLNSDDGFHDKDSETVQDRTTELVRAEESENSSEEMCKESEHSNKPDCVVDVSKNLDACKCENSDINTSNCEKYKKLETDHSNGDTFVPSNTGTREKVVTDKLFYLRNTYNVKLGETEACICVLDMLPR